MKKKVYAVSAKDRKQYNDLNVFSPAPEILKTFGDKKKAKKYASSKKKLYNTVKFNEFDLDLI